MGGGGVTTKTYIYIYIFNLLLYEPLLLLRLQLLSHGIYSVLLLSALEYTEQGGDKAFGVFGVTPPVDSTGGIA